MNPGYLKRADFSDTLVLPQSPFAAAPAADPIEQMVLADRADWALLRLVLCASVATLLLALATSLHA